MTTITPLRQRRLAMRPEGAVATAVVLATVLLGWELACRLLKIPVSVLPGPVAVVTDAGWGEVFDATLATAWATMLGFLVGNAVGLVLALLISSSRTASDLVFPGAIVVRSIPIVALAPFITLAVGRGAFAAVVVAALIVFFPTLVNVLAGLRATPREALELMHVTNAGSIFTYVRVRMPYAGPSFVAALKIAAPAAVLGVMTAEWILGTGGLGQFIIQSWLSLEIPTVWAAVIASATLAWALFALVSLLERLMLSWAVQT